MYEVTSNLVMKRLTHPYYYGEVVGGSVDAARTGAVQARIIGVTDKWDARLQPWVYPQLMQGVVQVPQNGHWLLVKFKDGDINQGMYYAISPTRNFLPEQYMSGYPDIAVMNMGETGYLYTHNRASHTSTITNPGNDSTLTWTETGELSLASTRNSDEVGRMTVPVLTEATIDIFTCMPVGNPSSGVRAGSEYLSVSHISKQTIDTLRGNGSGEVKRASDPMDEAADGQETRDIQGVTKEYGIPFIESPASIRRSAKVAKRILVTATGNNPLAEALAIYEDSASRACAHYLVGVGDGSMDVMAELSDRNDAKNLGFVQCVEVTNDATIGADMKGKPNLDAVSIVFYGDGNLNEYQMGKFSDIVNHVKKSFNLETIDVVAYKQTASTPKQIAVWNNLLAMEGEY